MSGAEQDPGLARLQRWLQAASTDAAGLDAGLRRAQVELGLDAGELEAVVDSGFGIDARRRVGIYHRGYFARLLECLRAEYAVLSRSFSREWFDRLGRLYLARQPSGSWTLSELGAGFPAFLAAERPDAGGGEREPAFDFMLDLARLERSWVEIGRGPGIENNDLTVFDGLENRDPATVLLTVSPSLRLMRSSFALVEFFAAARSGRQVPLPDPRQQCIALCRRDYQPRAYAIEAWQHELLAGLTEDVHLAPALARVAAAHPADPVAARGPIWLALGAERGFFATLSTE